MASLLGSRRRSFRAILVVSLLILAASGTVGPADAGNRPAVVDQTPSAVRVSMKEFMFKPGTVRVQAGSTVTWTYDESATDLAPNCEGPEFRLVPAASCPGHSTTSATVVNGKPLWDSGVHRAPGFPYSVKFATPGTYPYYCIVHGGPHPNNPITHMNGVIIVDPAPVVARSVNSASSRAPASPTVASTSGSSGSLASATLPKTGPETPVTLPVAGVLAGVGLVIAELDRRIRRAPAS